MKFRNLIPIVPLLVVCSPFAQAQTTSVPIHTRIESLARLEKSVRQSRTKSINPQTRPPSWMDYDKVSLGFDFLKRHQEFIQQILATSSLASTFAARDITPVLMQTGQLPKDFSRRMKATDTIMHAIMQSPDSRDAFLTNNLTQAYKLGQLHTGVAKQVKGTLHWNPREHAPMNQQAVGFVLYSFAWWPVEALDATRQIDRSHAQEEKELEGWFHLWSVIGYEMGVSEDLLPTSAERAKEMVTLLRKAQYAGAGENLPVGIPDLLGGHVRWLVELTAAKAADRASKTPSTAQSAAGPSPEQLMARVAQSFAQVIRLSPGLSDALGLGNDPAAQLIKYAALPAPN